LDRELFNAYADDYLKDVILTNPEHCLVDSGSDGQGGAGRFKYKIPSNPLGEIIKYHEWIETIPS